MLRTIQTIRRLRLVPYLLSGASAFSAEYLTFVGLFYGANWPLIVSNTLSFLLGFVVSFSLNKSWVFGGLQRRRTITQLVLYFGLALLNIVITNGLIHLFTQLGLAAFVAKLIIVGLIASWNFVLFKTVIFRATPSTQQVK